MENVTSSSLHISTPNPSKAETSVNGALPDKEELKTIPREPNGEKPRNNIEPEEQASKQRGLVLSESSIGTQLSIRKRE